MNDFLAKQVAQALEHDGVREIFLAMTEEQRIDICLAYAESEVKKFNLFFQHYMTNTKVKETFRGAVFDLIKLQIAA